MPEVNLTDWNHFLESHPEAHLLQLGEWGEFKKELIAILLANQGTPVRTKLFMDHFAKKYAVPTETRQQRYALSQRILRRLEEMADKGVISKRRATDGRREVYWLWVGL